MLTLLHYVRLQSYCVRMWHSGLWRILKVSFNPHESLICATLVISQATIKVVLWFSLVRLQSLRNNTPQTAHPSLPVTKVGVEATDVSKPTIFHWTFSWDCLRSKCSLLILQELMKLHFLILTVFLHKVIPLTCLIEAGPFLLHHSYGGEHLQSYSWLHN